jgi:hypothetical protein
MICRHCSSDCCHAWDTPKSCPPRRNWPWVLFVVVSLLCGLLPALIVGVLQ